MLEKLETLTVYIARERIKGTDILVEHVGACDGTAGLTLLRDERHGSYYVQPFCSRCRVEIKAVR